MKKGDKCEKGAQLRPHIVWFGEDVPLMPRAAEEAAAADVLVVVGTSLQVHPAAGLAFLAPSTARRILIDPRPPSVEGFEILAEGAAAGLAKLALSP